MKLYPSVLLAAALLSSAASHAAPLSAESQSGVSPADSKQEVIAPELAAAEDRMERHDLDGARPQVEQYLSRHPHDPRALFDLGYLEEAAGHDDRAADRYRQAIAANPGQFESRLALGLLLARQGKQEEARKQLQQATAVAASAPNPDARAQAFRGLAELDRTADPEAARDALVAALQVSPETPADLLLTAQIADAAGDAATAEEAYRRLLANLPENGSGLASEATSGLAQILLRQQKYGDSETLLRAALAHNPDEPALNAQLATALMAQGKDQEALASLEKVHNQEPGNAAVSQMLADAYAQSGHPEKADPIYAAMVLAQPDDPVLIGEQGKNLILEGRYTQAQKALERAVRLKPGDGEAWSELAFAASENKQYSAALEALSMRAKYLPETAASYFLKATLYDKLHDNTAAKETYRRFLTAAAGQFPDQERQARERLVALGRSR